MGHDPQAHWFHRAPKILVESHRDLIDTLRMVQAFVFGWKEFRLPEAKNDENHPAVLNMPGMMAALHRATSDARQSFPPAEHLFGTYAGAVASFRDLAEPSLHRLVLVFSQRLINDFLDGIEYPIEHLDVEKHWYNALDAHILRSCIVSPVGREQLDYFVAYLPDNDDIVAWFAMLQQELFRTWQMAPCFRDGKYEKLSPDSPEGQEAFTPDDEEGRAIRCVRYFLLAHFGQCDWQVFDCVESLAEEEVCILANILHGYFHDKLCGELATYNADDLAEEGPALLDQCSRQWDEMQAHWEFNSPIDDRFAKAHQKSRDIVDRIVEMRDRRPDEPTESSAQVPSSFTVFDVEHQRDVLFDETDTKKWGPISEGENGLSEDGTFHRRAEQRLYWHSPGDWTLISQYDWWDIDEPHGPEAKRLFRSCPFCETDVA